MLLPDPFYNRHDELQALERGWEHGPGGHLALVLGRRRVGKTYLLQRFFSSGLYTENATRPHCYYLAEQVTADVQRLKLAERLLDAFPTPGMARTDLAVSWDAIFRYVSHQASKRAKTETRMSLILDEFPYLVSQTPELPSILQAWWDMEGTHLRVCVILCGSQLSAMSALRVQSAPLFGRFGTNLNVGPLRYDDAANFYRGSALYGAKEQLMMYGILGGTPRYHAMVNTGQPMAKEVVNLLMRPGSPLESEVKVLLSSEQIRDPAPYNAILSAIAHGKTQYGEIQNATGIDATGLSHPLKALQELDWVSREVSFGETTDKRGLYRIADPFLRFWYRFVEPLKSELQFSDPWQVYAESIEPHLAQYMGFNVFEDICKQWLMRNAKTQLGLRIHELRRYWSRDGRTEIDIVGELQSGGLLFGECKWSAQRPVGLAVFSELRAKVLGLPNRRWIEGASYILFSFGGFAPDLERLAQEPLEDGGRLYLVDGKRLTDPAPTIFSDETEPREPMVVREKAVRSYSESYSDVRPAKGRRRTKKA